MARWETVESLDGDIHVRPLDDVVDHRCRPSCVCGPMVEQVTPSCSLVVHNSLDGREQSE